jgi:hypothetical protein
MVTAQLLSSNNYDPVIQKVGTPHQKLTLKQCGVF